MTPDQFQSAICSFQQRTPFQVYVIELVSGDRVRVDHPEALVCRGGVAVFVSADGAPVIFDYRGVSQITATPSDTAAA